jgi:hypothetical protein
MPAVHLAYRVDVHRSAVVLFAVFHLHSGRHYVLLGWTAVAKQANH